VQAQMNRDQAVSHFSFNFDQHCIQLVQILLRLQLFRYGLFLYMHPFLVLDFVSDTELKTSTMTSLKRGRSVT
jgi:hypothetical protein